MTQHLTTETQRMWTTQRRLLLRCTTGGGFLTRAVALGTRCHSNASSSRDSRCDERGAEDANEAGEERLRAGGWS